MTLDDLQALTFATIEDYVETRGIGKYRGIRYRTAKYTAVDAAAQEHIYAVKVSSKGLVKVKDLGSTPEQHERNIQVRYDALEPNTKVAIEALEMPFNNLLQKLTVGDLMEGRIHMPSIHAVLGASHRVQRLRELFPIVTTFVEAIAALQAFAKDISNPNTNCTRLAT
jgi:hypothetical protein